MAGIHEYGVWDIGDGSTLTIASGAITVTAGAHIVAAESGTTDDLDTISLASSLSGVSRMLLLLQADAGDTITVKHGTGNINFNSAADFALSGDKTLLLYYDGTNWADVGTGGGSGAVSSVFGRTGAVVATASDYDASQIDNTAAGNIVATDVQAAINELDTEKVATSRTITAGVGLTGGGDLSANRTLDFSIDSLTADASPDGATDYVATFDASATGHKKVLLNNLPGGGGSGLYSDYVLIRDEKAQNTAGGTFTSGAWRTRDLNTEVVDTGGHASLASNQITLAAGTWRGCIITTAFQVNENQARLQNVTDALTIDVSLCADTPYENTTVVIACRFTLAASKTLEVQHRCLTTKATDGFGRQSNFATEIYTIVELWKES